MCVLELVIISGCMYTPDPTFVAMAQMGLHIDVLPLNLALTT